MISPYQILKNQRISKPKIIIKGTRKIKKEKNNLVKIKRKCIKIKYYY